MNYYEGGHTGPGFLSLLLVVFITLKLVDKIDWSWWWVLAPLWGPFALAAVIFVPILAWAWYKGEL